MFFSDRFIVEIIKFYFRYILLCVGFFIIYNYKNFKRKKEGAVFLNIILRNVIVYFLFSENT